MSEVSSGMLGLCAPWRDLAADPWDGVCLDEGLLRERDSRCWLDVFCWLDGVPVDSVGVFERLFLSSGFGGGDLLCVRLVDGVLSYVFGECPRSWFSFGSLVGGVL